MIIWDEDGSETATSDHDREMPKETYISLEDRQLLDNTPSQSFKFKTKNWVEINHESRGTYNKDNQIRFKASMLRSSLCD